MKKTKLIFLIAVIMAFIFIADVFLLNFFVSQNGKNAANSENLNAQNTAGNLGKGLVSLSLNEISKHNSGTDCWMIINNKVYDVTSYINSHPGGKNELIKGCGIDATDLFNTKGNKGSSHSSTADSLLNSFYIGDLNQEIAVSDLENKTSSIKNMTLPKGGDDEEEYEDEYEDD